MNFCDKEWTVNRQTFMLIINQDLFVSLPQHCVCIWIYNFKFLKGEAPPVGHVSYEKIIVLLPFSYLHFFKINFRFRQNLKDISLKMHQRNEKLVQKYEYLYPEEIPNSISI